MNAKVLFYDKFKYVLNKVAENVSCITLYDIKLLTQKLFLYIGLVNQAMGVISTS